MFHILINYLFYIKEKKISIFYIMKDKFLTYIDEKSKIYSFKQNKARNKNKENQNKEYYTKSRNSSDLSSLSSTQSEAFSQNSENFYIKNNIIPCQNSNYQKNYISKESNISYFDNIINYFKKTEPEKFVQYKNSKNFLSKRKRENIYNSYNLNSNSNNNLGNQYSNWEENKSKPIYYINIDNNVYYNIMKGNIFCYIYNNYFNTFPINQSNCENNTVKSDIKKEIYENTTEEKVIDTNNFEEKEEREEIEEKEEKIETPIKNDIEVIKVEKNNNKNEDNYLFAKRNTKKIIKESNTENRNIDKEYYETNKYRKRNEFNVNGYQFFPKNFSNNYRGKYKQYGHYNKFNNFGINRKNCFIENKFYKNKNYQQMYY